ncbi:hypothetical protein D1007_39739 [Hordeum vulgare]|nr:hypothetical protein D1007_39739 [Hordeum vulgare]
MDGITSTRTSPRIASSKTRDPVVLEDLRKTVRRVKTTVEHPAKPNTKDPLEHIHSKLATSGNVEIHESSVDKYLVGPHTIAANFDARKSPSTPVADMHTTTGGSDRTGSDESESTRTAEVLPTLVSMRDAVEM